MVYRVIFSCLLLLSIGCKKKPEAVDPKMNFDLGMRVMAPQSGQVVEVRTSGWSDIHGTMLLWDYNDSTYVLKDSFPVLVGRNGLAIDTSFSLKSMLTGPQKKEGDGCSPAGVFNLSLVFSYHPTENLKMPFKQVTKNDLCVDDVQSVYYNKLIAADTIEKPDYKSFEYMQRDDHQYEYGVWVNYNTDFVRKGDGSCIFLHIYKDNQTPTSGCTAMEKSDMMTLIQWLDSSKNPVLVQFPTKWQ
jgi:L,D-peptidoglycan transpeptidase YkuD (ErfK/YbiS/YcfS/YnhG family)